MTTVQPVSINTQPLSQSKKPKKGAPVLKGMGYGAGAGALASATLSATMIHYMKTDLVKAAQEHGTNVKNLKILVRSLVAVPVVTACTTAGLLIGCGVKIARHFNNKKD